MSEGEQIFNNIVFYGFWWLVAIAVWDYVIGPRYKEYKEQQASQRRIQVKRSNEKAEIKEKQNSDAYFTYKASAVETKLLDEDILRAEKKLELRFREVTAEGLENLAPYFKELLNNGCKIIIYYDKLYKGQTISESRFASRIDYRHLPWEYDNNEDWLIRDDAYVCHGDIDFLNPERNDESQTYIKDFRPSYLKELKSKLK